MPSIKIHDTTLRDGEQMPGVVFDFDEKIRIAEKLVDFGVDLIDIMPSVSEGEFRVAKELSKRYGNMISATCRAKKEEIDRAIDAGASRVTLFLPVSDLHITQKLKITREENLARAADIVDYARAHGLSVDFAGEDASRADPEYLKLFLCEIQDKISSFFIADTVGCLTPESARKIVWYAKNNCRCAIGLHMHNDFGMATANTMEGILAGAEIFSGTFTGIGERAGNAPIEEICAALRYLQEIELDVKYGMLKDICDMVQDFSGVKVQKHKPLVGENAFAHESGVHVDGVLKNPRTYEFIAPEDVGQKRRIYFGKHSGAAVLKNMIGDADVLEILDQIKALSEKGKVSFSEDELLEVVESFRKGQTQQMSM